MTSLSRRTTLILGALVTATMTSTTAFSGDVIQVADRCAVYGPGFVDLGNGSCGQVNRARINGGASGWNNGGAANAGLRTDGLGMLPGAENAGHLRVQANPGFH